MSEQVSSYFNTMIASELEDVVGPKNLKTRHADKFVHSVDYYWVPRLWVDRGRQPNLPDYVIYPESTEQVSNILKIANQHRIPVTVWGGGAGSQGGALPVLGGIILDMKKMNRITEINDQAYTVTVETGIIHQHLEWELNKRNLSTMHLPASIGCSTLGGFLAHRGTGVLSTKYGKIEDLIINMEVVLPDGEVVQTLAVPRNAAGPDLNQLFIGSEGTYGVITKATVKIFDEPECRKYRAFMFENMHDALEAGRTIMTRRLMPCVIRMYDEAETKHQIERVLGIEKEGAYLVFGFDGYEEIVDIQLRIAMDICKKTAKEDLGGEMGEIWWKNKYKFFFPPFIMDIPEAFGTMDTVATYDKVEKIYWEMKKTAESFPGTKFIAHFSHWYEWGCMMYDRFIIHPDHVPDDPDEAIKLYNRVWYKCIRAALDNGGLLNEHHGIGLKMGYLMKEQYGPAFRILQDFKKILDPNNIMNPGKMGL
jgi:alkyldihydroxyacetonephosphate synthase